MAQEPPGPVVPAAPEETVPLIAAGSRIFARVVRRTVVDCPKCKRVLNVTHVAVGMTMTCPADGCGNVTWRPDIEPHWWFPVRKFVLATIGSFLLGVLSSLVATWVWEGHRPTQVPPQREQQEKATKD